MKNIPTTMDNCFDAMDIKSLDMVLIFIFLILSSSVYTPCLPFRANRIINKAKVAMAKIIKINKPIEYSC